jgi:hypothetical protein
MASFVERKNYDDIVRWEMYEGYTRKAVVVHNRTGSPITLADVMGQPLRTDSIVATDVMFCQAGAESYCVGLLSHRGSFAISNLANLGVFNSKMLARGPAIVDQSMIPTTDVLGASLTVATIVTALQGLTPPVVCNLEHPVTVTQTT